MKKLYFLTVFLIFFSFLAFGETGDQEEVDFLLFMPNSGNEFANEDRARVQLNNIARYINSRNLSTGQISVFGYTAFAVSDVEPFGLSRERAAFVINQLVRRGVPNHLFSDPVGYGSVFTWGDNTDEEDRVPNRRVRIVIEEIAITPEVLFEAGYYEETSSDVEEAIPAETSTETETRIFDIPWLILFPFLLLPLLFLLFRKKDKHDDRHDNKSDDRSERTETPAAAPVAVPVTETKTTEHIVNLEEEIRFRAYEHHLMHCEQYTDVDGDWYKALPEVCARYEGKGYWTYPEDGTWWARKSVKK
ncbi:MAG: hypothetical protein FWD28_05415 [Treponema sp.]|nr:hypothetical protein [Treponema sp.]